jgi:hypothetical protein
MLAEGSKMACHAELVEAWWAGLYARSFDGLRMTGHFSLFAGARVYFFLLK